MCEEIDRSANNKHSWSNGMMSAFQAGEPVVHIHIKLDVNEGENPPATPTSHLSSVSRQETQGFDVTRTFATRENASDASPFNFVQVTREQNHSKSGYFCNTSQKKVKRCEFVWRQD
ncbi:hypothetical protein PROFUN_13912 [Planoprotostelium fungivorum]|uniref:Uncharacterized protein n=1 Tax=Planoprotostelium fungivorum TaxID=1890364 RepID=A0A2P6N2W0_9EUKA|nr:hypothetical protein PROFUN_13912 [Planoprotostelium fungivorum]